MMDFRTGVLCCLLLVLTGCGTSRLGVRYPHAGAGDAEVCRDLVTFPQDLSVYAERAGGDARLIPEERQRALAADFVQNFYGPWQRKQSLYKAQDVFYFVSSHPEGRLGYGENLRPITPRSWRPLVANCNMDQFPSSSAHGIAVRNTALRAMPTNKPFYKNPEQAGEGYPFDYFSHSALWVGSPVFISHTSKDGLWFFVETQRVSGWVPVQDVALADENFKARWRALPLGAVTGDGVILGSHKSGSPGTGASNVMAHVGTLLPVKDTHVLYPVRGLNGEAHMAEAPLSGIFSVAESVVAVDGKTQAVRPFPVPLTASNLAEVGNVMMGQPYGWGGFLENRDCSALMLDVFTPFGLWLPRNSGQQGRAGKVASIKEMSATAKKEYIASKGKPFTSLIWLPGHIVLYVGQYDGEPAVYHDVWGVAVQGECGEKSRAVIGKVSVTSLSPGAELEVISSPSGILDRMESVVFLGEK